ncbi:MAG TPA: SHOCT domain-containing protein [Conexibacter sp.]|jgi:hypothetical protein
MPEFTGYRMTVELSDTELVIRRVGLAAKAVGAEVRVPLDALTAVRFKDANAMVNGSLSLVVPGQQSRSAGQASDPYTIMFRRKTRDEMAELRRLLEERIARNRETGLDPGAVSFERVVGSLEAKVQRAEHAAGRGGESFAGVTIDGDRISAPGQTGGLIARARATVDTAGQLSRRITATRLVLTGPLALAWRKKRDERELYLLVEGVGWAISVPVDPKKGQEARAFAARINSLASSQPAAPAQAAVADGPDPFEQIARLAELHERGAISDEDFERKRQDLLDRI